MKTLLKKIILSGVVVALMSGCGPSSYNGLVNVVAVGAGEKPTSVSDKNYVETESLPNIIVYHTPGIKIKEQDVSTKTKYIAGDALTKEYTGAPSLLVDYLNKYHSLDNKVLILDTRGVVAWSGYFRGSDVTQAMGVYDYGLLGTDRISFDEAMGKYVMDKEDAEEYKKDKKIVFTDDEKYPFLFAKYPNMRVGNNDLSKVISNNKPSVLIFFMSKDTSEGTLSGDVDSVVNAVKFFSGQESSSSLTPQSVLQNIEDVYFEKK